MKTPVLEHARIPRSGLEAVPRRPITVGNPGDPPPEGTPLANQGDPLGWLSGWLATAIQTGSGMYARMLAPASIWSRADAAIAFRNPWRERLFPARRRGAACCMRTGAADRRGVPLVRRHQGYRRGTVPGPPGPGTSTPDNPAVRPTAARSGPQTASMKRRCRAPAP